MKTSLWVVLVVVAGFLGFLLGYSVSSYTGIQKVQGGYVAESGGYAEAGGYGEESGEESVESSEFGERQEYYGDK